MKNCDDDSHYDYIGGVPCKSCGRDIAIHVSCDNNCLALLNPNTLEDYKLAYEHWRDHSCNYGCSHGA